MAVTASGFTKDSQTVLIGLLRAADCAVVVAASLAAYYLRTESFALPGLYVSATILGALLTANFMHMANVYALRNLQRTGMEIGRVVLGWLAIMASLLLISYLTQTAEVFARSWVMLWAAFSLGGFLLLRAAASLQIQRWQERGVLDHRVAIVGSGPLGVAVARQLRESGNKALRLVGFYEPREGGPEGPVEGLPRLGSAEQLVPRIQDGEIDEVIIALPWEQESAIRQILHRLQTLSINVRLCPDVFTLYLPVRSLTSVAGIAMLDVFERPLSGWDLVVKNLEDRVLGPLLFVIFLPLCLVIALAIKLDSPGPVLFRQKRYGFHNNVIEVMKFRTMHVRQEEAGVPQATRNDPRVTRVGKWLRRTSLDELPQLINVLRGEMSLVGPRPHAIDHNKMYAAMIDAYLGRHRVKPGMTGWAQVNGLRGETKTVEQMRLRVQHDLYYIDHWTLWLDLKIMLLTLLVGFVHEKAY
jgi:putative colanic acid biosynthesis UDP-glucose lipid carrier transferase